MNDSILLAEKPFISIQGEGKYQGVRSLYIRFYGCDCACTLCDSRYAVDDPKYTINYTEDELYDLISSFKNGHIVLTGGEPMLFQDIVYSLIKQFPYKQFQIETNGNFEIKF